MVTGISIGSRVNMRTAHIFLARFSMSEALSSVGQKNFSLHSYAAYVDVEMAFTNTDANQHH
jgi:hypothetical protein